ncbi:MAG: FtsX-like permease family protein [Chloroflexi bacterium]|nr:MAG: FtsX-like permease family protein [Chloroflexota bacterium]
MLGIIIGVGAVIALLSIGQGAGAAITSEIQGIGSNLIIVIPGAVEQGGGGGPAQALGTAPSLTLEDAYALADPHNVPHAAGVAPILQRRGQVIYGGNNVNTEIIGVTPSYQQVRNWGLARGRFITQTDMDTLARVAVLGKLPAEELFDGADPIGEIIRIERVPFRVVGVLEERGGGGFFGFTEDDRIMIPITTAQSRLLGARAIRGGGHLVSVINVSATSEADIDRAIEEITLTLRRRHNIEFGEDDFTLFTQQDLLGAFNQITTILTLFLGAIAAISLLVGGIGIMNIMLVSVTERTREIGIRKAVGARRRDILVQFLIEAIVLSVIGGVIGILIGAGIAQIVNSFDVITTVVSLQAIALAVGFSIAVGVFFGIYPAWRAAQLNPIEALRYE